MLLRNITDAQLDAMAERYYDRLLDKWNGEGEPEHICENCRYYDRDGFCTNESILPEDVDGCLEMDPDHECEDGFDSIMREEDDY